MPKNKRDKIIPILVICISLLSLATFLRLTKINPRPNIILITIDALRADHLSCYGYPRNTSPNIDRLAKEGVEFLNCFTTSNGTVYSLPGLLTGRYLEIGRDYLFLDNILDKKFTTLAEYLKNAGYYTAAFVNNGHLKTGKGFEQGFDYYRNKWYGKEAAGQMTASALGFLDYYGSKKPVFLWIHYLDTHVPYSSPETYLKRFEDDGLYKTKDRIIELSPAGVHNPYTSGGYIPKVVLRQGRYNLNYYIASYDAEILHVDYCVGKLLGNIKSNTIIILTADHGEFLGEHNYYFTHEEDIYDESLHVPLIIKDSRDFKGGKKVSTVVSSLDIVPTILNRVAQVQYFFNRGRLNGIDLKEVAENKETRRKYIFAYYPWARSIRDIDNNIKYILRGRGKEELYLLPDEHHNLIDDGPSRISAVRKDLKMKMKNWLKTYPLRSDTHSKKMALDKDAEELLRSLGYIQ